MRDLLELLREIEAGGAYPRGSTRQALALARVRAQYETKAKRLQPEQAALYDRLFLALVDGADLAARADLARTLAAYRRSPCAIVELLAAAPEPEIAAPLLEHAIVLREDDLRRLAETRGDAHRAAIARRATLPPTVGGVLAERGSEAVVEALALNAGAAFDEAGHACLAARAQTSARVRAAALCRADLPEPLAARLLALDREALLADLEARCGAGAVDGAALVEGLLAALADPSRERYDASRLAPHVAHVAARLQGRGMRGMGERHLARFLERRQTEDAIALLAASSGLPAALVQRILFAEGPLPIAILVRALGFGWATLKVLATGMFAKASLAEQNALYRVFDALEPESARALVRHAGLHRRIRVFAAAPSGAGMRDAA